MKTLTHARCFVLVVVLVTGCRSMLPVETQYGQSRWTSYADAQAIFDQIIPHKTTLTELRQMGFDPQITPNIKVLTYVDLLKFFLPNASITMADLHPDVRRAIVKKDACCAYELEITSTNKKRYGSIFADILGFQRKSHITGWRISILVIVLNDTVTYKLRSGEPKIDRLERKHKPLGPFQELDGFGSRFAGSIL